MHIDFPKSDKPFILQLTSRLKTLQKIETINQGGCAIVAHAGYYFVMKHAPRLEPQIVYVTLQSLDNLIKNISNNIPDSCNHAVLSLSGKYYFDSSGFIGDSIDALASHIGIREKNAIVSINVDPDLCLESIRSPYVSWNKSFKRNNESLRKIKSIFETKQDYSYYKSSSKASA